MACGRMSHNKRQNGEHYLPIRLVPVGVLLLAHWSLPTGVWMVPPPCVDVEPRLTSSPTTRVGVGRGCNAWSVPTSTDTSGR
jgi:hypothetical protein